MSQGLSTTHESRGGTEDHERARDLAPTTQELQDQRLDDLTKKIDTTSSIDTLRDIEQEVMDLLRVAEETRARYDQLNGRGSEHISDEYLQALRDLLQDLAGKIEGPHEKTPGQSADHETVSNIDLMNSSFQGEFRLDDIGLIDTKNPGNSEDRLSPAEALSIIESARSYEEFVEGVRKNLVYSTGSQVNITEKEFVGLKEQSEKYKLQREQRDTTILRDIQSLFPQIIQLTEQVNGAIQQGDIDQIKVESRALQEIHTRLDTLLSHHATEDTQSMIIETLSSITKARYQAEKYLFEHDHSQEGIQKVQNFKQAITDIYFAQLGEADPSLAQELAQNRDALNAQLSNAHRADIQQEGSSILDTLSRKPKDLENLGKLLHYSNGSVLTLDNATQKQIIELFHTFPIDDIFQKGSLDERANVGGDIERSLPIFRHISQNGGDPEVKKAAEDAANTVETFIKNSKENNQKILASYLTSSSQSLMLLDDIMLLTEELNIKDVNEYSDLWGKMDFPESAYVLPTIEEFNSRIQAVFPDHSFTPDELAYLHGEYYHFRNKDTAILTGMSSQDFFQNYKSTRAEAAGSADKSVTDSSTVDTPKEATTNAAPNYTELLSRLSPGESLRIDATNTIRKLSTNEYRVNETKARNPEQVQTLVELNSTLHKLGLGSLAGRPETLDLIRVILHTLHGQNTPNIPKFDAPNFAEFGDDIALVLLETISGKDDVDNNLSIEDRSRDLSRDLRAQAINGDRPHLISLGAIRRDGSIDTSKVGTLLSDKLSNGYRPKFRENTSTSQELPTEPPPATEANIT